MNNDIDLNEVQTEIQQMFEGGADKHQIAKYAVTVGSQGRYAKSLVKVFRR